MFNSMSQSPKKHPAAGAPEGAAQEAAGRRNNSAPAGHGTVRSGEAHQKGGKAIPSRIGAVLEGDTKEEQGSFTGFTGFQITMWQARDGWHIEAHDTSEVVSLQQKGLRSSYDAACELVYWLCVVTAECHQGQVRKEKA